MSLVPLPLVSVFSAPEGVTSTVISWGGEALSTSEFRSMRGGSSNTTGDGGMETLSATGTGDRDIVVGVADWVWGVSVGIPGDGLFILNATSESTDWYMS